MAIPQQKRDFMAAAARLGIALPRAGVIILPGETKSQNCWHMKKLYVLAAVGLLLCGCASSYVIKLNNGLRVTTASKPKLNHGFYVFKDAKGNVQQIPQNRVLEIAPADMVDESSSSFKPPKKK